MNTILIQGAEPSETNYLKSKLINPEEFNIGEFNFIKGKFNNTEVVISKTKVGEVNSAIATTIGILQFNPTLIINQGTAGGHGKEVHQGDIVIGKECLKLNSFYSEYKEEGQGFSLDNWKFKEYFSDEDTEKMKNWKNIDNSLVNKFVQKLSNITNKKIWVGCISSGDVWNRECDRILYLNNEFNSLCEEMETEGVYKTANHFNIPVIGIRIISNNEVLNEAYNPSIAEELQKIIYQMLSIK